MSNYDGIDDFPTAFPLVDDGTLPDAANYNPALQALADRTVWLRERLGEYSSPAQVLTTTSVVVPAWATHLQWEGCGAGGGGAGGCYSAGGSANSSCGGGGGGGAQLLRGLIEVTPGETITFTPGAGGPGGTGGNTSAEPTKGGDGGYSFIDTTSPGGPVSIAVLPGAEGGHAGLNAGAKAKYNIESEDVPHYQFCRGGSPVRHSFVGHQIVTSTFDRQSLCPDVPQQGGRGRSGNLSISGEKANPAPGGFGGGATGNPGTADGLYFGGGPGGGGGGGPYGPGVNGGNGGNGNASGAGSNGSNGQVATDYSGAGGAGGGSSGSGTSGIGVTGGNGGAGGSAQITYRFLRLRGDS